MTDFSSPGAAPRVPADQDVDFPESAPSGRRAELIERLQQGAEYVRSLQPDELKEEIEESIRARPILSVLLAATAGFLVGRLLRR